MKQEEQKLVDERGNTNKGIWRKPELTVLEVENTKGGAGPDDEGSFSFAS